MHVIPHTKIDFQRFWLSTFFLLEEIGKKLTDHVCFVYQALLAHLSRRLTRWTYSIPMVWCLVVRHRRRPHFQSWTSLNPVSQSWSNFMCSVTGVGERLLKVLGQIGSKPWFPWQQKAPIDLRWGKRCCHLFSVVFDPILFILAGYQDMHKISEEFEIWPDQTLTTELAALERLKNFPWT